MSQPHRTLAPPSSDLRSLHTSPSSGLLNRWSCGCSTAPSHHCIHFGLFHVLLFGLTRRQSNLLVHALSLKPNLIPQVTGGAVEQSVGSSSGRVLSNRPQVSSSDFRRLTLKSASACFVWRQCAELVPHGFLHARPETCVRMLPLCALLTAVAFAFLQQHDLAVAFCAEAPVYVKRTSSPRLACQHLCEQLQAEGATMHLPTSPPT
mmetsp:Transcript_62952/g.151932  ORF Transcript_62952/g.151932 Transcript_62952/m.151932 type:complete len:206 (+) Transcript_62952:373-990(+)